MARISPQPIRIVLNTNGKYGSSWAGKLSSLSDNLKYKGDLSLEWISAISSPALITLLAGSEEGLPL